MPKKLKFTTQELEEYFSGEFKAAGKEESVELADKIRVHADGLYPKDIIEEARPNESEEVRKYRKKIWKPKTRQPFMKVLNSLSKIRRSVDWSVQYPNETPLRVADGETLEDYCEKNYPYFKSVTNWAFSVLLREYLIDPNSICLVVPMAIPTDPVEMLKPYGIIFSSSDVIDYREDDYAVIENPLGVTFYEEDIAKKGKSFYLVTTQTFQIYNQVTSKPTFKLATEYQHQLGTLPAYKLGAVMRKALENNFIYESRIEPMVASLDEAAREYSDLQAGKVMHMFPERWQITTTDCPQCKGSGTIKLAENALPIPCQKCGGSGNADPSATPYSKLLVRHSALDSAAGATMPIPPAGFVEKDVEIIKLQRDGVKDHLFEALAAVNMEFLAQVPLAESGIAKETDRDETKNFVHSVAEDIVRILDWLYWIIAKYRHGVQYPSDEQIKEMLPTIPVPEHYDLFSTVYIETEIKNAKENKLNPVIINAMEISYASKKFNAEPEVKDRVELILALDPLANISEDDKNSRLQNGGISQQDYVVSSNISQFIQRALEEDQRFANKSLKEQQELVRKYADEIIASTSAKTEVLAGDEDEGDELTENET